MLYNLGTALYNQRKRTEADTTYRRCLSLKPDIAEAHNNLGNILHEKGQTRSC